MEPKITINGKEIKNLSDLPQSVQNILSDENENGVPDIAENPLSMFGKLGDIKDLSKNAGLIFEQMAGMQNGVINEQKIVINGKEYKSWDEIPESEKQEIKAKIQQIKHLTPTKTTQELSQNLPVTGSSEIPVTNSPAIQEQQDKTRIKIFIAGIVVLIGYLLYKYVSGA